MAPSTFASAAAGSNSNNSANRVDGDSEWSRRTNGATQTFRRPSAAASYSTSGHQREISLESQPARYVPPHRNGVVSDTRYSKDQLLDLFKTQHDNESLQRDSLTSLYVAGWEPDQVNGVHEGENGWQRRDDNGQNPMGSSAFWSNEASMLPIGLVELTEDEKETFSSSVNSPMKAMTNTGREGTGRDGLPLRKISVSHNPNSPGGFSLNSPSAARPTGRRREPSESYPFPSNPLASPKPRDENRTTSPPPALRRRTTDFKDPNVETKPSEQDTGGAGEAGEVSRHSAAPNSRVATNPLSAGLGGPASPWGTVQPSPGFAPMGAFGSFGATSASAAPGEKRPGFGSGRAESRFKGLMSKDSSDDMGKVLKEKSSMGNFGKPADNSAWRMGWPDTSRSSMEQEHDVPTGSAALGGGEETSPPPLRGLQNFGTPHRPDNRDDFGFSAFGMTPDTGLKGLVQDQHQMHGRGQHQVAEAMSPTTTNPYQSPQQGHAETDDLDTDDSELHNIPLPGLGGVNDELGPMPGNFGGGFHGFSAAPGDRSQTSSAGPNRAFSGLSGLGAMSGFGGSTGWGALPNTVATPIRERAAHGGFGDHAFGSSAEMQSPSLAGLGPSNFFGQAQSMAPGVGRGGSRMGPLFQQGSQDPMRSMEGMLPGHEDKSTLMQQHAPGLPQGDEPDIRSANVPEGESVSFDTSQPNANINPGSSQAPGQAPSQAPASAGPNQPPAAQQRTMVMPDRMRWIYRDPQGNTQGPWSGLEMHDWYKAGFFSPELLVKKYEDTDYEPLAQLIRRIGNSREPFLVPQIGIPHGPPQSGWGTGPVAPATGQPPFAASFPSFGTTLTADQQNALERRKQEEQYLMARQKEHLAQQQMAQRMQLTGQPSMGSLHSQPSFGSVPSGSSYQPQSMPGSQGQAGPGFDGAIPQSRNFGGAGSMPSTGRAGLDSLAQGGDSLPSSLNKLDLNQLPLGAPGQAFPQQHQLQQDQDMHRQQVYAMLDDRARLQSEQAQHDAAHQAIHDQPLHNDRLDEFKQLQQDIDFDQEQAVQQQAEAENQLNSVQRDAIERQRAANAQMQQTPTKEPRTLTEQVQQAMSAKQSPSAPWNKVDTVLPQPFPPAPSQSPLPAPAAQRNRSHVADALHAESHSGSQSPSLETPTASVAPWAKEPAEAPKGPSLREIQEAEAKNAAKAEAIAAEARRAALEKENLLQMQAAAAAAVGPPSAGLPSSSTWASTGAASPVAPSAGSAWSKATKPVAGPTNAKSMAQIQKEEEARKKRIAAAAAVAQQSAALSGAAQITGKRYAELASKVAAAAAPSPGIPGAAAPGSAWMTVGASGKAKPPPGAPAAPVRAPSSTAAPAISSVAKKPAIGRTPTTGSPAAVNAHEEFKRWAAGELRGDLNKGVNAEEFVTNLLAFPNELDIVTEAVHSVSTTIDSRHYAEEFLKRRKLAEKGMFDASIAGKSASPANGDTGRNDGGWSEVAKKGPKEASKDATDLTGSFKVVAAKKKGVKR